MPARLGTRGPRAPGGPSRRGVQGELARCPLYDGPTGRKETVPPPEGSCAEPLSAATSSPVPPPIGARPQGAGDQHLALAGPHLSGEGQPRLLPRSAHAPSHPPRVCIQAPAEP